MTARKFSPFDKLLIQFDRSLKTMLGNSTTPYRVSPAQSITDGSLSHQEKQRSARLMRVNHAGEVAAQALYQGQSLTTRNPKIRAQMQHSAQEESDHLSWCEQRLDELDAHKSFANPVWYLGSAAIGATAGLIGDKWSLGFVVETERQVEHHLASHLEKLPTNDAKSRAILIQMKTDEIKHANTAQQAGAATLPRPIKKLMHLTSRIMTKTAYWI